VPSSTSLFKRLLLGRPFRSDKLGETLLPKRIALPVFASDALSSVAYAPDEILLTLSVSGMSAYVFSPWIGLLVAVVMVTVVASYRQNVHAYPSGGGDYEVVTKNLGPSWGLVVASALLPGTGSLSRSFWSRCSPRSTCGASASPARRSRSPPTAS
jgi:amino acid transporter